MRRIVVLLLLSACLLGSQAVDASSLSGSTAILKEGRTFVPLRAVFEWMGAEVDYHARKITATRGSDTVKLTIGSREASVNGRSIRIGKAPFVSGGRTYVPLRFVAESLGAEVAYDASSQTVRLSYSDRTASIQVRRELAGSLNPFPQTLSALRKNPRALAAARAVAEGSDGYQQLADYGKNTGWNLSHPKQHGPFVFLLCLCDVDGYSAVLREEVGGYRFLMGLQDCPSIDDIRRAGITCDEYRQYLYECFGSWPWTRSGGTVRDW